MLLAKASACGRRRAAITDNDRPIMNPYKRTGALSGGPFVNLISILNRMLIIENDFH